MAWFLVFVFAVWIGVLYRRNKDAESSIKGAQDDAAASKSRADALEAAASKAETSVAHYRSLAESIKRDKLFTEQDLERTNRRLQELISSSARGDKAFSSLEKVLDHYARDMSDRINDAVTHLNIESSKKRLNKVFSFCREYIPRFGEEFEKSAWESLEVAHRQAIQREEERQEQILIREQMREEAKAERERQQEISRLDKERERLQNELEKAMLKKQTEKSAAEIESLRAALADAAQASERTKAMAELTKRGHVYVISNIGSFGENIFKVGMTRRLIPQDRIDELGDASVPFPFDVHMMIHSEDAPALEYKLHRALHRHRVNRINLRKEFFEVSLDQIKQIVEDLHGRIEYQIAAEAHQYRQSLVTELDAWDDAAEAAAKVPEEVLAG